VAPDARAHLPEMVVHLDSVEHYSSNHRIVGLSDGVLAIAMTLLSLHLIEDLPHADLPLSARGFFDHYGVLLLIYAMSFVILGVYWVGHAIQFHYVIRADRPLMVRTVLFLFFVSLVPFTTGYLGRAPFDEVAIGLYCSNLMLCGLALQWTLLHATKDPLMLHHAMDRRIFRGVRAAYLAGPILYALAFVVSLFSVVAGFAICVSVPILTFFPNPFWGRVYARFIGNRQAAIEEEAAERAGAKAP
jgi:uncharacterized membrane protein